MVEAVWWQPDTYVLSEHLIREPSLSFKLYVFFLIAACVVASIRLIKVWRIAPPFKHSRQANNPVLLGMLQALIDSLKQWIWCTIFVTLILVVTGLHGVCAALLNEGVPARAGILFAIEDFSTALSMALLVVLFLFLTRWHLLTRIKQISNSQIGQ
jgi:hypothetical protein